MSKYLYLLIATCRLRGRDQSKEADEAAVRCWDDGEAEEAEEGWQLKEISMEEEECGAGSEREIQKKATLRCCTLSIYIAN
jgi:hypothetical protein